MKDFTMVEANFPVREESLVTSKSGILTNHKAIINEDTDRIVGVASDKYQTVLHKDVQSFFDTQIATFFPRRLQMESQPNYISPMTEESMSRNIISMTLHIRSR